MHEHDHAEAALRRLIEASELPEPDAVEYRDRDAVLIWHEPKLAVSVDLEKAATPS